MRRAPGTSSWRAGSGAYAPLVAALNVRRVVAMFAGDFETARTQGVIEEVLKQVTGTRRASYGDLFLAAFEGLPERAHAADHCHD